MLVYERKVPISAKIRTGGGLWSSTERKVSLCDMELCSYDYQEGEGFDFGELKIYFDTKTWDVKEHGLIYTDQKFMRHLQQYLTELGLRGDDVSYSEQGMQGKDYVSCDVGGDFITSFFDKYETESCPTND